MMLIKIWAFFNLFLAVVNFSLFVFASHLTISLIAGILCLISGIFMLIVANDL